MVNQRTLKSRGCSVAGKAGALIGKALKNELSLRVILALPDTLQGSAIFTLHLL